MHDDFEIKPLYIRFLKTSAYIKSYGSQTKWMYILIEDDDLLKKYNTICDNVSSDIKKNFYSKTFHNNFFFGNFMVMKLQILRIKKCLT